MNVEKMTASAQQQYCREIVAIVKDRLSPGVMRDRLSDFHPRDIAESLPIFTPVDRKKLSVILTNDVLAEVLEYAEDAAQYLDELPISKRIAVLSLMESTLVADYLQGLEKSESHSILELLPSDCKREIRLLASFGEDEIGSRMSTNYISIKRGMSVREAMRSLVDQAAQNDNVSKIYVVDENGSFYGAIDLKDLIVAREGDSLESLTVASYPYLYATEPIEECIERIRDYSEDSIPILDFENCLQGVLTLYDMTDLIDEAMEEDYARLAGLGAQEDLREPIVKSIGKRLPWLAVLLVLGMAVSTVVGLFETVVAELAVIVSFQSLILGMAGNAGTQSLAITIRVLSDDALSKRNRLLLLSKEARVGALNGLLMGLLSFCFVGTYLYLAKDASGTFAFSVSACTGIALCMAMFLSSVAGTVIPMLFQKLKIDPAVASGPLITTVNDLFAVVIYYGLAWLLLIQRLS